MSSTTKVTLRARQIHKAYYAPEKIPVLQGVDLEVRAGETVAITGQSGQGKTTLLHVLGTLENPCSGSLEIMGQALSWHNKSRIRNKNLAFIFQSFHLLEDYTALENVLIPARIARMNTSPGSSAYQRGLDLLHSVGLSERCHFHTKLLSGGEKQRVAIARALCNDPDLIFADEPSGNLDETTAQHIHDLLLGYAKNHGKSIIVVTHNPHLAERCDTRYHLQGGCLGISHN